MAKPILDDDLWALIEPLLLGRRQRPLFTPQPVPVPKTSAPQGQRLPSLGSDFAAAETLAGAGGGGAGE